MAFNVKPSLDWLLLFVPAAAILEHTAPQSATLIFLAACLAIIPLAGLMGRATEHLADRTGEAVGGLLNATFGNAAEFIIALVALSKGMTEVVKASLTGSIIGNILLVMGAAFLAGGLRNKHQKFNAAGVRAYSSMLTIAAIALIAPTAYHYLGGRDAILHEVGLSVDVAVILLITYALSLLFSLKTHKHLYVSGGAVAPDKGHAKHAWPVGKAVGVLLAATALTAWVSEILVGSVEAAAHTFGMTPIFVGVIVVAIIGNAAEHSTAVLAAWKDRMDLCMGIALGSSLQIALFVAPALVLASFFIGPKPMDLVFTLPELLAVVVSITIASQVSNDGESNWLEGVQLLSVYAILGVVFYFLPGA